ncbi:MAG: ketosteroid isomerase-like protein [Myxococcota bacterium]
MHANADLLTRFYTAFQQRDHATMAAAYAEDARFSDPVFPDLRGGHIGGMWRMLCERGTDLDLTFSAVEADDTQGKAHWEATYTFSATGRKVHNVIDAAFTFRDGRIATHDDTFDLWAWTRMALGPMGMVLGWSSLVQGRVRGQAGQQLERFCDKRDITA